MSLNIVNKTTGALSQVAGNADDSGIGNLNSLTTTDKSSLVNAVNEVKSGLTGLVKTHTETGLTTNIYGIVNLTLPSTNYVVDAVCSNYIVIPYRSSAGNHWELVITDVSQDGTIEVQRNETVDVTVHYI